MNGCEEMKKKYYCELSDYKSEEDAKRALLKSAKKEWEVREVVTQSEGYSYEIIHEFEQGKNICFFVKDKDRLYYCGPVNIRWKKLSIYSLWTYDYCVYIDGKMILIKELSYLWDTLSSFYMPEELICNPLVTMEKKGEFQIVRMGKIYEISDFNNIYVIDALPSSDDICRTYTLTLYNNGNLINRIQDVYNFEPSIGLPDRIYYQNVLNDEYVICDYANGWMCESCEYPESYYRIKERQDFWILMSWCDINGNSQMYQMNKIQERLFEERIPIYTIGYFDYFFSTTNPIADIIIDNYFAKYAKVIRYPKMFKEDFSHNYWIRINHNDVELLHMWIYFSMEQMVTDPCVCGVKVCNLGRLFKQEKRTELDDETAQVIQLIKKRIGEFEKFIQILMRKYPYSVIMAPYGTSFKHEKNINKNEYLYVNNNRQHMYEKYHYILTDLIQQGKINQRWKSEFNLFIITKSYFANAIYQYRTDWLQGQSLDIYIPELKLGIEYQGIQHYEAVDLFGGEEGLKATQERDKIKKKKCKENKITLFEWHYTKKINDWNFVKMLNDFNYKVPTKQNVSYQFAVAENEEDDRLSEVVCKYDLQGNLIEQYETIAAASMQSNVKEDMIRRSCSGIRNSSGGYQWRKMPRDCVEVKIAELKQEYSSGKARKVAQISEEGEVIVVYNSIAEAVRLTGVNSKSIRDAATGKQKHAGGFKWKYQD